MAWHEFLFDKKFGTETSRIASLNSLALDGDESADAHPYQAASALISREVLNSVDKDLLAGQFIDLGAGKGRSLILAAEAGFDHVMGVELAKDLEIIASENITRVKKQFPAVSFSWAIENAANFKIPSNCTVLYMFNPFGAKVMDQVCKNVLNSLHSHPRNMNIIYINPRFLEVWGANGFAIYKQLKSKNYLEAVILRLEQ